MDRQMGGKTVFSQFASVWGQSLQNYDIQMHENYLFCLLQVR